MFVRFCSISMMRVSVLVLVCAFSWCQCEGLHLIKPKLGQCFDIYPEGQPIYLSKSLKTCTAKIPEISNCIGLRTQNQEVINLGCAEEEEAQDGCYRLLNADRTNGTVCQKLDEGRQCEVITTPTGITVEVFCYPVQEDRNVIYVKSLKV